MESASSIHHHQLQEHLLGSSSSCYGLTGSTTHDNTSSPFLNTNGFYPYPSETNLNQRLSSNYSFMAPDLGFQWATAGNQTTQDLQVSRNIKEELLDNYYLKYSTELVSNISNQEVLTNPVPSDMSLQPVDLLPSSRFSGSFSPISSQNQIGFSKGFSYSLNHMQQSYLMPFSTSNKISSNGRAAEAKRTCSTKMEPNAPKKSRLEGRASCPPFKVRKEKLGDRIAALQQLVAPFGKTDTASVLMEAIGYIKLLQTQVETLSVPYIRRSWNKTTRLMKVDSTENKNEEDLKRDLKSRGLCLVPLSCMSYITDGGGGVVWLPSPFGGAA